MEPSNERSQKASVTPNQNGDTRPHTRNTGQMPSEHDQELAIIFREMRRASDASLEQLAARFNTSVDTLQALEAGAILALPDWQETTRVVTSYAGSLGLDSRPVLRRIKAHLALHSRKAQSENAQPVHVRRTAELEAVPGSPSQPPPQPAEAPTPGEPSPAPRAAQPTPQSQPARSTGPAPAPPPPQSPPLPPDAGERTGASAAADVVVPDAKMDAAPRVEAPKPQVGETKAVRRRRMPRAGTIITWALLLILFAAMGMGVRFAVERPQLVWSTVDSLPDPAPRLLRSAWELVRPFKESERKPASPDLSLQKSDRLPNEQSPQGN